MEWSLTLFDWLGQTFSEFSVGWLVLTAVVGGIAGASVKFLFEDLISPNVSNRRALKVVRSKYSMPLLKAADSLERRINNIIRNSDKNWYSESEYYRLSSLFIFGEYLALVRAVERDLSYLPFGSSKNGKIFTKKLYSPFRALTSFAYFRDEGNRDDVDSSQVPRLMLTAVGEKMTAPEGGVVNFTEFAILYSTDEQFRRWFFDIDRLIKDALSGDSISWDRLIATGVNLRTFIWFLDPKGRVLDKSKIANLSMIRGNGVLKQLRKELQSVANEWR